MIAYMIINFDSKLPSVRLIYTIWLLTSASIFFLFFSLIYTNQHGFSWFISYLSLLYWQKASRFVLMHLSPPSCFSIFHMFLKNFLLTFGLGIKRRLKFFCWEDQLWFSLILNDDVLTGSQRKYWIFSVVIYINE